MDFSFDSEVFILLFLFDEEDFLGFGVEWAWSCLEVVSVLFFGFAVFCFYVWFGFCGAPSFVWLWTSF